LIDAAIFCTSGEAPYSIGEIDIDASEATIRLFDASGNVVGEGVADQTDTRPIPIYDGQVHCATLVPGEDANHALFVAGDGEYSFPIGAASFAASCVLPLASLGGFFGFRIGNDSINGGNIAIVGEQGVQLTAGEEVEVSASGEQVDVTRVQIHAVGDPQFLTRQCNDISRRPLRFIREVVFQYNDFTHVCKPDELGSILMLADSPATTESALQIRPTEEALIIRLAGKSI
jgi:hypothetical protein